MNKKGAVGECVQSCEEDQFQSDWKESLQTKLTNETLIMKSNSIIDQNSTPGDDELNDETIDAENSEDDADFINGNRVTRTRVQECWITSLQDLMHGCDELRDEYIRVIVTVSVLLQSPARVIRTPRRSS